MSTSPAPGTPSSPVGAAPSADPAPPEDHAAPDAPASAVALPAKASASAGASAPAGPSAPAGDSAPSMRSLRSWAIAAGQSLLCLGIGLFIFLMMLGELLFEFDDAPPQSLLVLVGADALVGLVLGLAIGPLRFLRPGRAHAAMHLVLVAAGGLSSWSLPATAIALYRIGLRRRLVLDAAALVLLTAVVAGWTSLDSHLRGTSDTRLFLATLGVMLVLALVPLLVGRVVSTRHELIRTLRERAASAERESASADRERASAERERVSAEQARASAQREADALRLGRDAEAARVRAEERAALARDMHDSVSHHLSAIAMHAGAMAYREDLDPETLRRTATTVRDAAQQANRELREVLVALRTTADAAPLASLPTLQETVERARAHGQQVDLDLSGLAPEDFEQLGRGTVVALARILAEGLTNATKHSPGGPVSVLLARRDEQVVLTVRNPLTGADAERTPARTVLSTGHGLVGVEERARLLGGGARWSRTGHVFEMEAWMPW